jgi:hypothetical protein
VQLSDAGGGSGNWSVAIDQRGGQGSVAVTAPAVVSVPGSFEVQVAVSVGAPEADVTGFVVLTSGADSRRIPFWLRVTSPQLGRQRHGVLKRTGTYSANTLERPAVVDAYRYPDNPSGAGIPVNLAGPEQVFTVRLTKAVANFGVAVIGHAPGVSIQPRVVADDDENRLTGYPALPININPYLAGFFNPEPVAGAVLPSKGTYDVVFDSTSRSNAGKFTFRFWIGDTTRPSARLITRSLRAGSPLRVKVSDRGSGVDPQSFVAAVDGKSVSVSYSRTGNLATISLARLAALAPGRHKLVFQASDYQESRNMEDVGPILPNTRKITTTFRIK